MGAAFASDIAELFDAPPVATNNTPAPTPRRVDVGAGNSDPLAIVGEAYEGAGQRNREVAMWTPPRRSADAEILPAKYLADSRTRDSVRNDAYIMGGVNLHRDNIVGAYFMLNAKPVSTVLFGKEDNTWEEEFQEEVEEKFSLYVESPENWLDASRATTLTGLVRLAVGINTVIGEVLASVEWLRDAGRPFHTAVQMIDTDRLSTPPAQMGDRRVRAGVRRDERGAPLGYYVQMAHPSDWLTPESYQWKYVPVRKPWGRLQMIHVFEGNRADQTRGIAQMVAALKEMRMTKNFRDIVLQKAVVEASYAATIESDLPAQAIFQQLGGDVTSETIAKALNNYVGSFLSQTGDYINGSQNLKIDGTSIPQLPPGTKLQIRPSGNGGPLGDKFEQSLLRHIAAALDVSYEQLSRDYTQTNYSSARAAMTETWKAMQSRKKMVADRFATIIYRLWLEEAINSGQITSLPRRAPSLYEGQNFDAYAYCDWVGASRGQIDELKETQAAVLRLNNGLSTLEQENARLGQDWRKQLRQIKREQEWKDFYGILRAPTDTANQMNAASGSRNEKDDGDE